MASSQISDVRQALKTIFTAAGHTCFAYPPGDTNTTATKSYVVLETVSASQEHLVMGGSRSELMDVSGVIVHYEPGATDAVAKTAEDAALAILDDLEAGLRTTPGLSDSDVFHAQFGGVDSSDVTADSGNRVAVLRFTVTVETHI